MLIKSFGRPVDENVYEEVLVIDGRQIVERPSEGRNASAWGYTCDDSEP